MELFPLFPSLVAIDEINEDIQELNSIRDYEYHTVSVSGGCSTKRYDVLNDFPNSKKIILSHFKRFVKDVLQLGYDQFEITTSWGTRHNTKQFSDLHNHKNCFYSSVIYLDDVEEGGELCFSSLGLDHSSYLINRSTRPNQYNTDSFFIKPCKNNIVFFPSYLMHRVMPYNGKSTRYSIAVNYTPVGSYGERDSMIHVEPQRVVSKPEVI